MSDPIITVCGYALGEGGKKQDVRATLHLTPALLEAWSALMDVNNGHTPIDDMLELHQGLPDHKCGAWLSRLQGDVPHIRINFESRAGLTIGTDIKNSSISPLGMVIANNPAALRALLACRPMGALSGLAIREAAKRRQPECIAILLENGYRVDADNTFVKGMNDADRVYLFSVYRELDLQAPAAKPGTAVRHRL